MGEEFNDSTDSTLIDVKLYDVIIKNKAHPLQKTARSRLHVKDIPLKVIIAEMLKNVKDTHNILTYLYQRN